MSADRDPSEGSLRPAGIDAHAAVRGLRRFVTDIGRGVWGKVRAEGVRDAAEAVFAVIDERVDVLASKNAGKPSQQDQRVLAELTQLRDAVELRVRRLLEE